MWISHTSPEVKRDGRARLTVLNLYATKQVREKGNDSTVKVEARSLAEEIGSFKFQICCVVWCDILSKINTTSKLQSTNMQLDVAVGLIQKNKEN